MAVDKAAITASYHTKLQKKVLVWDYSQLHEESKECRTQIVRGDDGGGLGDLQTAALTSCRKDSEFYSAKFAVESSESFTENDLVFLCKEKDHTTSAFGIVEGRQIMEVSLRLYLDGPESMPRHKYVNKSLAAARLALQVIGSGWSISKLSSLSTILREYVGLCSLSSFSFTDVILSAKLPPGVSSANPKSIPRGLMDYLSERHNASQLQAIQAGLSPMPLVLIQGPPGTGKTQTILGILSVLLHASAPMLSSDAALRTTHELSMQEKQTHWLKASPWLGGQNPRDVILPIDGDEGFFPEAPNLFRPETVGTVTRKHRAHVLVCAPSNSALDEIVLRLLKSGIRDENGEQYVPSIVRVGLNAHHSVQSVCMDNLVEQRLKSIDRSMNKGGSKGDERDRVRLAILEEAAIVCSTLSFSGSNVFARMKRGFDVVVIDEAAQAVEPSTLVPFAYGCKQAILVGDPKQLPATVLSEQAVNQGYRVSMFERFQKAGYPVQMLNTQYRMHPQIREFPSREFYEEGLEDGADVERQTTRPWHEYYCFGPLAFFDIDGKEDKPTAGSYQNVDEAEFVLVLYRHLIALYPELKGGPHVAVISPYKRQVATLRERFTEVLGPEAARLVDINTVDGFQGREKDIAIFSCVRTGKQIGFVGDERRVNVGLTRARASMLVVGCAEALERDEHWNNLIVHARQAGRLIKVRKPFHSLFNEASLATMLVENIAPPQQAPPPVQIESVEQMPLDAAQDQEQPEAQDEGDAEEFDEGGYEE